MNANPKPPDLSRLSRWLERDFCCAMSVGSLCQSAMALKYAELRKFAGPFDWVFSSPDVIAHCISDNFGMFLNKSMYLDTSEGERASIKDNVCEHVYYRDYFGMKFMFNHRSPNPPRAYAYLQRCVQRFRLAMEYDEPKLLLMVTRSYAPSESYRKLLTGLSAYQTEFLLVVIRPVLDPSKAGRFRLVDIDLGENFIALEMYASSESNGVSFENSDDDAVLVKLLRRFKVKSELPEKLNAYIDNIVSAADFDGDWYLKMNLDVAQAVWDGRIESAWEHYVKYGREEGRKARRKPVDYD